LHALATRASFDGIVLAEAGAATFARRRTAVPRELPIALTQEFAEIPGKPEQWAGFTRRLVAATPAPDLPQVIATIASFGGPVLRAIARGELFSKTWSPAGLPGNVGTWA
jgi:hypothetical protein